jgi:hypothetical protein
VLPVPSGWSVRDEQCVTWRVELGRGRGAFAQFVNL